MQFGIMTGFAVTGPGYSTANPDGSIAQLQSNAAFNTLSFILMASRLILTFQYSVAFWWVRKYKKAWWPMLAHIGILFTSAMIFLGLSFAFSANISASVLAGWYVVVGIEAIAILAISGNVPFLSFRRTVLVERLGLLTLIILGEGIIGMCTSINNVGSGGAYSPEIIGQIICSVSTIYAMWMLYFDQVQPERMGTLRQHIWAVLHFPFHVCILLVVEGLSRLSVWRKVLDVVLPLQHAADDILFEGADLTKTIGQLNSSLSSAYGKFPHSAVAVPDLDKYYELINSGIGNGTSEHNTTAIELGVHDIYQQGLLWICENFKVNATKAEDSPNATSEERAAAVFHLFETVFTYFFVFAGLNLLILGLLFLLGKRRKLRGELLSVGVRWVAGLGLILLTIMTAPALGGSTNSGNSLHAYMYSSWMLPTVLIVYLIGVYFRSPVFVVGPLT